MNVCNWFLIVSLYYLINFRIEAPTTSIHMHAEKEIRIYAPAADMTISTLKEIQMRSKDSIVST